MTFSDDAYILSSGFRLHERRARRRLIFSYNCSPKVWFQCKFFPSSPTFLDKEHKAKGLIKTYLYGRPKLLRMVYTLDPSVPLLSKEESAGKLESLLSSSNLSISKLDLWILSSLIFRRKRMKAACLQLKTLSLYGFMRMKK